MANQTMIRVDDLNYADIPNIKVEPANELFKELGLNTYDFVDLISEFIDNSIAARNNDELLKVHIEIGFSEITKEESYFLIRDNAKGIPREFLGKAITPGGMAGGKTLNEHGLGMKQAAAALGSIKYLATKTSDDNEAIIIEEFKFGEIFPKICDVTWDHGTEICIEKLNATVPRALQSYTKTVATSLGARYRRYIKSSNPLMQLNIVLLDLDDRDSNGDPAEIKNIIISEIKPIYFHPNKRKNEPVILKHKFKGTSWQAEFTFGYAPTDGEYLEMGLQSPKQYEPYKVSISKQGFDIIRTDRVIKSHQLSEINIVPQRHNKYNYVRGEIDLIKGFTTAITKNQIIYDDNFSELVTQIKEFLDEKKFLEKRTYPDEIPESLLRDRLASHLHNRTIDPKNNVTTEYAIEGLGGYIDILADGEAWELKIQAADGLDVYQLFAYMDMGNLDKGYLVAPDFKTGAKAAINFIKNNHAKNILLVKTCEFPITDAPTLDEIKKYY